MNWGLRSPLYDDVIKLFMEHRMFKKLLKLFAIGFAAVTGAAAPLWFLQLIMWQRQLSHLLG